MKKRLLSLLALMLVSIIMLASCSPSSNDSDPKTSGETVDSKEEAGSEDTTAKEGDVVIKIGVMQDILSFDPHGYTGIASTIPGRHIYDTLVRIMPDDSLEPCLAESWEVLDPTTIEFKLRYDK